MRHDPIPTTLHIMDESVDCVDVVEKPKTVELDWSTRNKIVIRPRCQESVSNQRTFSRKVSIFSQKRQDVQGDPSPAPEVALKPLAHNESVEPLQSHTVIPVCQVEPAETSRPAVALTCKKPKSKTLESGKIQKHLKQSKRTSPDAIPPMSTSSRKVNTTAPRKIAPLPTGPKALLKSQYADEYARCGCTANNKPPCQRCQLMLLADRFCALIDTQCDKWGAPPHK